MTDARLIHRALEAYERERAEEARTTPDDKVQTAAFIAIGSRFGACAQTMRGSVIDAPARWVAVVEADGLTLRVRHDGTNDEVTALVLDEADEIVWESRPVETLVELGQVIAERIANTQPPPDKPGKSTSHG